MAEGSTMQIWPGTAYPLGATYDGSGTNFALFSEVAERVELCLFDADGAEYRHRPARDRRLRLARVPSGRRTRPAIRLSGARPLRSVHAATGAIRASCCSIRTPRPSTARSSGTSHCSATTSAIRDSRNDEDSAGAHAEVGGDQSVLRLGRRPTAEAAVRRHGDLRGARQGPHADASGRFRPSCAAPTPRSPIRSIIEHLQSLGVTAIELMPVHHFANDSTLIDTGLSNYWGYNTIGFFAPDPKYSTSASPGRAGAGVQGDGPRAARGRHRSDPRRRLQPHRRGQPPGADAVLRASTTRRTTGSSTTTRYYMDYTGTGNSLNVRPPARACS